MKSHHESETPGAVFFSMPECLQITQPLLELRGEILEKWFLNGTGRAVRGAGARGRVEKRTERVLPHLEKEKSERELQRVGRGKIREGTSGGDRGYQRKRALPRRECMIFI